MNQDDIFVIEHDAVVIEFVYFDLGNVLVSFDPLLACDNVARLFHVTPTAVHAAVYESAHQTRYEHGELSGEEFASLVREQLGRSSGQMPTAALLDALSDMFTPIESMRSIVNQVHQSGIRFGILSNTCAAHWDWITRQGWPVMQEAYGEIILSYEAGVMKPNPRIYRLAEQAAEVPRERILFLDDKPENVLAARARGWHAVACFGGDQAQQALRRYRVIGDCLSA